MPPRSLLRAFLALWVVTALVLLIASVQTAGEAIASSRQVNPHLAVLGIVEALATALFLVPRTMRLGATALVATIGVAFAVHATLGQFRGDLLLYGTAVVFVAIHRPLTTEQLRLALGRRAV